MRSSNFTPTLKSRTRPENTGILGLFAVRKVLALGLILAAVATPVRAQHVEILSLSRNGLITWTNSSLNVTCHVEWASTPAGPWLRSWASLTNIVVTNHTTVRRVPMFYRVVCERVRMATNLTAEAALELIEQRGRDQSFVILDVRRPDEYDPQHIVGAMNLNYYSPTFEEKLAALDRHKAYLVYCASGSRSGNTFGLMQTLGFTEIYNLLGGISAFRGVDGSADYLVP